MTTLGEALLLVVVVVVVLAVVVLVVVLAVVLLVVVLAVLAVPRPPPPPRSGGLHSLSKSPLLLTLKVKILLRSAGGLHRGPGHGRQRRDLLQRVHRLAGEDRLGEGEGDVGRS